jgi:hypothetical protein
MAAVRQQRAVRRTRLALNRAVRHKVPGRTALANACDYIDLRRPSGQRVVRICAITTLDNELRRREARQVRFAGSSNIHNNLKRFRPVLYAKLTKFEHREKALPGARAMRTAADVFERDVHVRGLFVVLICCAVGAIQL